MQTKPKCATCGGTGRLYVGRSAFITDGYSHVRCGICGGAGHSTFKSDPEYTKFQRRLRERQQTVAAL